MHLCANHGHPRAGPACPADAAAPHCPLPANPGSLQHYSQAGSAGTFTAYQTADSTAAAAGAAVAADKAAEHAGTDKSGSEPEEGIDITFTATTSKGGSLLIGSSRYDGCFGA